MVFFQPCFLLVEVHFLNPKLFDPLLWRGSGTRRYWSISIGAWPCRVPWKIDICWWDGTLGMWDVDSSEMLTWVWNQSQVGEKATAAFRGWQILVDVWWMWLDVCWWHDLLVGCVLCDFFFVRDRLNWCLQISPSPVGKIWEISQMLSTSLSFLFWS